MKVPLWLFVLFPFLFPKTKKAVKLKIQNVFQERFEIVTKKLGIGQIPLPELKIVEPLDYHYDDKSKSVTISYSIITRANEKDMYRTIDHEITHYLHHKLNSKVLQSSSVGTFDALYWIVKKRMNINLAKRAFTEGFATYVAFLTTGELGFNEKTAEAIQNRNLLQIFFFSESLPYVLGYIMYSAIAKIESEEKAMQAGISLDLSEWLFKSRGVLAKLGSPCKI